MLVYNHVWVHPKAFHTATTRPDVLRAISVSKRQEGNYYPVELDEQQRAFLDEHDSDPRLKSTLGSFSRAAFVLGAFSSKGFLDKKAA